MLNAKALSVAFALWAFSCVATMVTRAPEALITAAPQLPRRQQSSSLALDPVNGAGFIGYTSIEGADKYYYRNCLDEFAYWSTGISGTMYGGCEAGSTNNPKATIYTSCFGETAWGVSFTSGATVDLTAIVSCEACFTDYRLVGFVTEYLVQCDTSRTPDIYTYMSKADLPPFIVAKASTALKTSTTEFTSARPSIPTASSSSFSTASPTDVPIIIPTVTPNESIIVSKGIKKVPIGPIVGGVGGGVIAIAGAVFLFLLKRRKTAKSSNEMPSAPVLIDQSNFSPGGGQNNHPIAEKFGAEVSSYPQPQPQLWVDPNSNNGTMSSAGVPPSQQQWNQNYVVSPPGSPPPPRYGAYATSQSQPVVHQLP